MWKSVAAGALGGLIGAFAMNQYQSLVSSAKTALSERSGASNDSGEQQSSSQDEDATIKTAKAISAGVFNHELTDEEKKWAGPLVHYGFGTTLGALYGFASETVPAAEAGLGSAYGAAVWLVADEIAVPAFGLSKPATETPLSSHIDALIAHLVFGVATALTKKLFVRS